MIGVYIKKKNENKNNKKKFCRPHFPRFSPKKYNMIIGFSKSEFISFFKKSPDV